MKKNFFFFCLLVCLGGCESTSLPRTHQSVVNRYSYAPPPSEAPRVVYHKYQHTYEGAR